jgi:hypothetical protein
VAHWPIRGRGREGRRYCWATPTYLLYWTPSSFTQTTPTPTLLPGSLGRFGRGRAVDRFIILWCLDSVDLFQVDSQPPKDRVCGRGAGGVRLLRLRRRPILMQGHITPRHRVADTRSRRPEPKPQASLTTLTRPDGATHNAGRNPPCTLFNRPTRPAPSPFDQSLVCLVCLHVIEPAFLTAHRSNDGEARSPLA